MWVTSRLSPYVCLCVCLNQIAIFVIMRPPLPVIHCLKIGQIGSDIRVCDFNRKCQSAIILLSQLQWILCTSLNSFAMTEIYKALVEMSSIGAEGYFKGSPSCIHRDKKFQTLV